MIYNNKSKEIESLPSPVLSEIAIGSLVNIFGVKDPTQNNGHSTGLLRYQGPLNYFEEPGLFGKIYDLVDVFVFDTIECAEDIWELGPKVQDFAFSTDGQATGALLVCFFFASVSAAFRQ